MKFLLDHCVPNRVATALQPRQLGRPEGRPLDSFLAPDRLTHLLSKPVRIRDHVRAIERADLAILHQHLAVAAGYGWYGDGNCCTGGARAFGRVAEA